MSGPFATYFGNQRTSSVPIVPTRHDLQTQGAVAVYDFGTILLGTNNVAGSNLHAYCYYAFAYPDLGGAASSAVIQLQWQFRTAAHANVGGAVAFCNFSVAATAAAGASTSPFFFYPAFPGHQSLLIPATAAEVTFQFNIAAVAGAPNVRAGAGWGIDITNQGNPGDIGGGGIVAQGANNPNTF